MNVVKFEQKYTKRQGTFLKYTQSSHTTTRARKQHEKAKSRLYSYCGAELPSWPYLEQLYDRGGA